ncbi:hypothetical protein EMCG_08942 [[Emmonsia] crescens]|uniref:Uncharacterized protein n=1 Tax=[Emmonsia] crescens TaxID=73230 RepID=A0A0G2I461_9EURO|nr:hypothetical protein EMCG_08942 [Emmonsia crescens UAMH 3008]
MTAKIHLQKFPSPDPSQTEMDFPDSSFFNIKSGNKRSLPTPIDVLARRTLKFIHDPRRLHLNISTSLSSLDLAW